MLRDKQDRNRYKILSRELPSNIALHSFSPFCMGFQFSFEGIDPMQGTVAASQKRKFDEMKGWVDSPFHNYVCNKSGNHFVLATKYRKVKCVNCLARFANARCANKMCKQCCISVGLNACKTHEKTIE